MNDATVQTHYPARISVLEDQQLLMALGQEEARYYALTYLIARMGRERAGGGGRQ